MSGLNEYGVLTAVALKHPRDAFLNEDAIAAQWRDLNFSAPPNFSRAVHEYERFVDLLASTAAEIVFLPPDEATTLDSIYTRDASIVAPGGVVACSMGKPQRAGEPMAQRREMGRRDWPMAGAIVSPGTLEGGDIVWLDQKTVIVGSGKRTNAEGIQQLEGLLEPYGCDVMKVQLPDVRSEHDVLHLMSFLSPVDRDLAVTYPRLMPESLRRALADRGMRFVDVPDDEYETMGSNVLAIAPRRCVMLDGNPRTRAALERAGASVAVYDGAEISLKGGGGPTCLTRPLARAV